MQFREVTVMVARGAKVMAVFESTAPRREREREQERARERETSLKWFHNHRIRERVGRQSHRESPGSSYSPRSEQFERITPP